MIEIEEQPPIDICVSCSSPIWWLWSPRKKLWIPFRGADHDNADVIEVDRCGLVDTVREPSWRRLPPKDPERAHRGAALVRQVLAGEDPFTEEERHG